MADANPVNGSAAKGDPELLSSSFRQKANFMKTWKPGSAPSNRDKLELYALHKQAVSGDAPNLLSSQLSTPAERAKFNAWRNKAGISQLEAMRLYLQESDRQIRIYGSSQPPSQQLLGNNDNPQSSSSSSLLQTPLNRPASGNDSNSETNPSAEPSLESPRGLAAIPLLCAAASESRQAYLRRLANTRFENAWWKRQESLTATPGSLFAIPEMILIGLAQLVEQISLNADALLLQIVPVDVSRSFLWPAHNSLLSLWMAYILVATAWTAFFEVAQTIVWGSRRTGLSLDVVWKEEILWCAQSVGTLTETHQPLTARLAGLFLWPLALLIGVANIVTFPLSKSLLFISLLGITWWYWFLVIPSFGGVLFFLSFVAGNCFAVIELAGT